VGYQYPNNTYGNQIEIDHQNNIIVAGYFGPYQSNGVFVHKYDGAGKLIWTTNIANAFGNRIAVTGNGKIIMSTMETPGYFITVFDVNGAQLRRKSIFPNSNEQRTIIAIAPAENEGYHLCGSFSGKITIGTLQVTAPNPGVHFYLAKFDSLDKCLWAVTSTSGTVGSSGPKLLVDSTGIYFGGTYSKVLGFGTNSIQSETVNGCLIKFDVSGHFKWLRNIGDGKNDSEVKSFSKDPSGNIYATGFTQQNDYQCGVLPYSVYLVKLDSSGICQWSKSMSSTKWCAAGAVDALSGNVYLTGAFQGNCIYEKGNLIGNNEPFVARYGYDGSLCWMTGCGSYTQTFGSSYDIRFSKGQVLLTGVLTGTMSFGGKILNNEGAGMFLVGMSNAPGVGLKELNAGDMLKVYPSPAHGELMIDSHGEEIRIIRIMGVDGRTFQPEITTDLNSRIIHVNIASVPEGIYVIETQSEQKCLRQKVVIE